MSMVEPAREEELAEAFRLVARLAEADERARRVEVGCQLVRRGELDRRGILVVRGPLGALRGAIVCAPLAGAGGLVWPPQANDDTQRPQIEDQLLQAGLAWLRQSGARLAQVLLPARELPAAAALERNGFQHVTALEYLKHDLELPTVCLRDGEQLEYEPYDGQARQLLHDTLLRTYEGTRDFPEVNGVRAIDEIIAGHRAQGQHDPQLWWLATHKGQAAGVLMLTAMPDGDGLDVIYLGVVPEMRGRGFGLELTLKAIYETKVSQQQQLTLSVDGRNQPAREMYRKAGFECHDRREVFLLVWR